MRKVSKSRVDDDVVSSTNGSVNDEGNAGADADFEDDDARDKEDANNGDRESDNDDYEPLDSISSKTSKTPKKSKKSKTPKSKKAKKSKKAHKAAKNDAKDDDATDVASEEEEEYEVEKVVGSKKIKGTVHYLIRWKGYSASSDTWEAEETLSCPELIKKFKEEGGEEESSPSKRGRKRKAGKGKKESKPTKRPKTDWDSENADENAEYEVERIMEVHHKKNGGREFLIHWKGWSSKFDSWEPEEHLNCTDLIEKFMSKVEKAKSSDSRSLRVNPESTNRYTLQAPSSGRRLSKRRGQSQRVRYDNAE